MMAQMMKPNPRAAERDESMQQLLEDSAAAYAMLPPDEKAMHDWAQKISFVRGQLCLSHPEYEKHYTREETALHVLTAGVGTAYALLMLADPKFRRIAGLPPRE